MNFLAHIADRIFGTPLLIKPEKLEIILGVLGGRVGLEKWDVPTPDMSRFAGNPAKNGLYRVSNNGIALVPIIGTLVNRGAFVGASSGLTSYEGITEQLKKASKDTDVRGILLDMNTPGGEAAGCFEVPELIREIRKTKPIVAMVNDMAASAGYAIAAAANQVYTTQTGILGSIGVVWVHFDRSKQLEDDGIKPTIIAAGARKADGHPFGPLPKDVKARLQSEIDNIRDIFVESVVTGRPKLKGDAIREMEAGVFMGEEAVKAGLADGVSTFDKVLEAMTSTLSKYVPVPPGYDTKPKEKAMTDVPAAQAASANDTARLDAVRGEGRTAERARLAAILALPEAAGRTEQAVALAIESDMTAEAAARVLAKTPKTAEATPTTKVYEAIAAAGGNPRVPAGSEAAGRADPSKANIARQAAKFKGAA